MRLLDVMTAAIAMIALGALVGCGAPPTDEARSGGEATWSSMDIQQRKQHMAAVVVPIAASVFQEWRPEHYAQIDCTLCHGQGVEDEHFAMPTDHLPRLSGQLLLGPEFRNHPDTTKLKLD